MTAMQSTTREPSEESEHSRRSINVGNKERTASMLGGAALALTGLTKLKQKKMLPGIAMVAAGSMFLYRGKTGHCDVYESLGVDTHDEDGVTIEKVLTINRSPNEVYEFWHNFENLPRFMRHLESVQTTGGKTSHWKAKGPGNLTVEWDAEILEDQPGQSISWKSLENSDIPNEGRVEFKAAPAERGTELKVNIHYFPPGGTAGRVAAKVANNISAQQIDEDLKRLKQILETGETATAQFTRSETTH